MKHLLILATLLLAATAPAQTVFVVYDAAGTIVANPAGGSTFASKASASAILPASAACSFSGYSIDLSTAPPTVSAKLPMQCAFASAGGGSAPLLASASTDCLAFTPLLWARSKLNTDVRTPLSVTVAETDSGGDGCNFAVRLDSPISGRGFAQ